MKKYLLLPLAVFLCATSPKNTLEKHPLKKHQDVSKMDFETLHDYFNTQRDLCGKSGKACGYAEDAYNEILKRGYHWHWAKQDGDQNCWLAPNEKSCDESYL